MPTFIAVRCPHCHSDQIVKRGKTARGTQRYLCHNALCIKGSFLLDYCNRGWGLLHIPQEGIFQKSGAEKAGEEVSVSA